MDPVQTALLGLGWLLRRHTLTRAMPLHSCLLAAGRLLQRINAAAGGDAATTINIHALLGRMTMEVIGQTAFGSEQHACVAVH
jgi:hypothetical protein